MKRILLSATAAALVAGPAAAADLLVKAPPPVVYDWSGFYLGAGAGTRSDNVTSSITSATVATPPVALNTPAFCTAIFGTGGCPNGDTLDRTAFRGSVYVGYNWQWTPRWVLGIEGDVGTANRTRSVTGPYPGAVAVGTAVMLGGTAADSFSVRTTWDSSIRGRLGWVANSDVLLYVTGGAEWLHLNETSNCSTGVNGVVNLTCGPGQFGATTLGPASIGHSFNRVGWTFGGGLEAKLAPHWVARGEVRYTSFGTVNATDVRNTTPFVAALSPLTVNYSTKVTETMATIGISYLWGGPAAPIYTKY
jgi:outer membrane immunogenic protein